MAVATINGSATAWNVEEASETYEYREKDDGTREFRAHCTIVFARDIHQLSDWRCDGAVADTTDTAFLTGSTLSLVDVGASPDAYAAGTKMLNIGLKPATGTDNYDNLTKISDITTPAGPKGSEHMKQTMEWVAVTQWADYPYDKSTGA